MSITFSSSTGKISPEDTTETGALAEAYFTTHQDPDQIPVNEENRRWIYEHIPECLNIIRDDEKIVGFSFILPTSYQIMEAFLSKKINEAKMFEEVKSSWSNTFIDAIYLCSAVVVPAYQRKGLASRAMTASIRQFTEKTGIKPSLFYWKFSVAGERLALHVAQNLKLELRHRKL